MHFKKLISKFSSKSQLKWNFAISVKFISNPNTNNSPSTYKQRIQQPVEDNESTSEINLTFHREQLKTIENEQLSEDK